MADEFNVREAGQKRARWEEAGELDLGGASFLHQATVTLDNDQIKALPGGVITEGFTPLVAALGVGRAFQIQRIDFMSHFEGGGYGNVSADSQIVGAVGTGIASYDDQTVAFRNLAPNTGLTAFLASTTPKTAFVGERVAIGDIGGGANIAFQTASVNVSIVENQPIGLYCFNADGDFNGGNAANSLLVTITYYILNTVTGEFE